MISVLDGFLGPGDCEFLVDAHRALCPRPSDRSDNAIDAARSPASEIARWAEGGAFALACRLFPGEGLGIDHAVLTALVPGFEHSPHADNCKLDGSPNHTPRRAVSALLYLDDEHGGGELVVAGITVPATAGRLVLFPSGLPFVHRTLPVTAGTRFAMPMWFRRAYP